MALRLSRRSFLASIAGGLVVAAAGALALARRGRAEDVVVAILRDGADPAYVDDLNAVFASFRSLQ